MSDTRNKMLRFIGDFLGTNGYPPSVREIMRHFGFKSPRAVSFHLEKLEAEGFLECHGKARGLRLKRLLPEDAIELPIYGVVPAGYPEQQSQLPLGTLSVHPSLISAGVAKHAYALRVKGDSMINAKIFDGDIAIVEQRPAKPNDVVVALIDGENTLKRLVQQGRRTFLKAENPSYPNLIPSEELTVQGVVIGIYRPVL